MESMPPTGVSLRVVTSWPEELTPVFAQAVTCEFASLTGQGQPITFPLNPYISEDYRALEVSTGLTYPAKANRARRNPKVALFYGDAVGSKLDHPSIVLVLGQASVRTSDLQGNTDRYMRISLAKLPEANEDSPPELVKRLGWYFSRIWIQVTPLEIYWWPRDQPDAPPQHWIAPTGTVAPPSDPAPRGKAPKPWARAPREWQSSARHAIKHLGLPTLTLVNAEGYPVILPASAVSLRQDGFDLTLPATLPAALAGKSCLTFHTHPEQFTGQQNLAFVGNVSTSDGHSIFHVDHRLADWSLAGSKLRAAWGLLGKVFVLGPRLKKEAARYGQPAPKINLPPEFLLRAKKAKKR